MPWYGDIDLEDVLDFKFTTVQSTGAPATLTGTGTIVCYVANSVTELTAGLTITRGFDSITGLNHVRVTATAANGYSLSQNYQVIIKTGSVNSVVVSGYVVGEFSIGFRSGLKPTTAKRLLDVSAGGEAGVDWANVGSPTTTLGLSGTTVKTATDVETDTADIQARIPAALTAEGNIKADTLRLSGALQTARDIGANVLLSSGTGTGQLKLASGYVAITWADVAAPTTAVDLSATTIKTTQKVDVETIKTNAVVNAGTITFPTNATVASTTNITAAAGAALTSAYDFAKGTAAMTESYNADGAAPTAIQALYLILQMLTEKSVASTTLTVNKLDGSTAAATFTLNDATNPSSITRAS